MAFPPIVMRNPLILIFIGFLTESNIWFVILLAFMYICAAFFTALYAAV